MNKLHINCIPGFRFFVYKHNLSELHIPPVTYTRYFVHVRNIIIYIIYILSTLTYVLCRENYLYLILVIYSRYSCARCSAHTHAKQYIIYVAVKGEQIFNKNISLDINFEFSIIIIQ